MHNYSFGFEGVENANVRIGIKHLVVVVFPVDKLQFKELQLLPCLLQLLLPLLQRLLQLLDKSQVLFLAGPLVEQQLELVVLFLHESDALPVFLNHVGKLLLHLLRPLDLLVDHCLHLPLLLSLQLFLPAYH
jgi:hypothetical protein